MHGGAERVAVSAYAILSKEPVRVYPHGKRSEDYDTQPSSSAERGYENGRAQEERVLLRRIAEGDASAFWNI